MKTFRVSLALLSFGLSLSAQDPQLPAMLPPSTATTAQPRSPQELEQLLAPIALYPDALIALILPASTVPTDVVLAARHLRENPGDRSQIEHRAWDESIKSLTNYPEVVQWMDENLHWTQQVGEAFATQSADVMQAIQRLRAKARAAGTLVDTPQQQVIAEPQVIRIVPAQPDIIYVPHYEPEIVFVDRPIYYGRPFLTFGAGVAVGSWLAFDCDWRRHSIWVGNRHRRWSGHDWHRPVVPIAPTYNYTRNPEVRQWRPPPSYSRTSVTVTHRFRPEVARPVPLGFASSRTNNTHYTHRDAGAASRHGDFHRPAVTSPLPNQSFRPGYRATPSIPQTAAPTPATTAPSLPITTPAPNPDASTNQRRGRDWSRDNNTNRGDNNDRSRGDDNRSRSFRHNAPAATPPTIVTTPSVAPTVPMQSSRPNHSMSNASPRSYSRSNSAPDSAPGLRMHGRSAPPAAVAPTPQPPPAPVATPPPAQPAPQQATPARSGGTEHRGHRGSTFRRDN
jgi:hypothetical protein